MENGFIVILRQILKWEWYDDVNTCRLFLHLLLTVNWEDGRWHGIEVKRGQRITSLSKLAKETRLSVQSVRTSIEHLKSTGELTSDSHSNFRLLTIKNYNQYQDNNKPPNKRLTNDQQTTNNNITRITKKQEEQVDTPPQKDSVLIDSGKSPERAPAPPLKIKHLDYVLLTDDEFKKLEARLGARISYWIERLNNYIGQKGVKYKSHYFTILNWSAEEQTPQIQRPKTDAEINAEFQSLTK